MICAYPFVIFCCFLVKKLLKKYVNNMRAGKKIISVLDSVVQSAFWNFPISTLYESYLIICLVSIIGMKDLVFADF